MMVRCVLLYLALFSSAYAQGQENTITMIPYPDKVRVEKGSFRLAGTVTYAVEGEAKNETAHLVSLLEKLELNVKSGSASASDLLLKINSTLCKNPEAYSLNINNQGIVIEAGANPGLFYGIQTLSQLIANTTKDGNELNLPFVSIEDSPRFTWRAMVLDEARTFHGKDVVKQLIDELAALKINRLQWHLTDDQGWRIQIMKYPELVHINSPLTLSDDISLSANAQLKKGYYTQAEVREIVQYASERYITIIPEIEMPGHASAAIATYPYLGVTKEKASIPVHEKPVKVTSIYPDIFDVTDTRTITFLHDVLDEVASLFNAEVIHIGGDEVNFSQWKESSAVLSFMKEKNLASPAALQLWFTNKMSNYLLNKGIRMMGWNDIMGQNLHHYENTSTNDFKLNDELAKSTIVHFWKGDPALIAETAKKGHDIVNAHHLFTYLDYTYEAIPLEKAYEFEPVPSDLPLKDQSKIIGLSCQMWGGSVCTIESIEKLHRQIFPRIAAYAEVGWTKPAHKDFARFGSALALLKQGWDERNISYQEY